VTLFDILNDQNNSEIISWTDTGQSFAIIDLNGLSSVILPRYFKHKNFSSFIRQLNMYDFHKIRDTGDVLIFKNRFFIKERPESLMKVKRKNPGPGQKIKETYDKELSKAKKKHRNLKEKVKDLESKLEEIVNVNKTLMDSVNFFSKNEKKIEDFWITCVENMKASYQGVNSFFW
jgi:hypothetical protein